MPRATWTISSTGRSDPFRPDRGRVRRSRTLPHPLGGRAPSAAGSQTEKDTPRPWANIDPDPAAVCLHDLAADRQAQSAPAIVRSSRVTTDEPLEDVPGQFGRDAGPLIVHRPTGAAVPQPRRDGHASSVRREADRVVHEVHGDLLDARPVREHRRTRALGHDPDPLRPSQHRGVLGHGLGDTSQIDRRAEQLERTVVGAREHQEVLHDRTHALDLLLGTLQCLARARRQIGIAKAHIEFSPHHREGGSEFVRCVRREAPLVLDASLEPVEHRVQRHRQAPDLIRRGRNVDPFVETLDPDPVSFAGHPRDGAKARPANHQPPRPATNNAIGTPIESWRSSSRTDRPTSSVDVATTITPEHVPGGRATASTRKASPSGPSEPSLAGPGRRRPI